VCNVVINRLTYHKTLFIFSSVQVKMSIEAEPVADNDVHVNVEVTRVCQHVGEQIVEE